MNEIKKTGRRYSTWYIIALGVIGCMLWLGVATPLMATEFQVTKKQRRLADRTGFMYGLDTGEARSQRPQRSVRKTTSQPRYHARPALKKTGKSLARKSSAKSRHTPVVKATKRSNVAHRSLAAHSKQERKKQQKSVARAQSGKRSGTYKLSRQSNHSKQTQTATREQRMGTFVEPVNVSGISRSSGLFFRVPENSDVVATSKGKVVYAGWFRGYGLLTILNHGGRVYSLYGHNRGLLVEKGDAVEPGQIIAKSGKTGSVDGVPGLYFEIRKGNKPQNPKQWLAKSKTRHEEMASLMR